VLGVRVSIRVKVRDRHAKVGKEKCVRMTGSRSEGSELGWCFWGGGSNPSPPARELGGAL